MNDNLEFEPEPEEEESSTARDDSSEEVSSNSKKRFNHWGAFGMVALGAVLTVIYISNVIDVNNMLEEKRNLERKHSLYKNMNKNLKYKINELKSADRIIKIAEDSLGMIKSKSAPNIIP